MGRKKRVNEARECFQGNWKAAVARVGQARTDRSECYRLTVHLCVKQRCQCEEFAGEQNTMQA